MNIDQLGPYRVVRKLGRGGMGTVYEGVNVETGEPAAVKILAAALADEEGFRDRFALEIESLRKLNHPGIVRLLGYGHQDGHLFYAMELVKGVTLEQELRRGRRFTWREATQLAVEVCRALRHAHDRGIVHRDLKPGNLLLGVDEHVKLADFGIARLFGHTPLTTVGGVLGTVEYMSPEQAEGRPADHRSDLYSLGGVIYTLLTGRAPFAAASMPEMLHRQRFALPEPARVLAPATPIDLDALLLQLLEKDPDKRVPNAVVLQRRLEALLTSTAETGAAPVATGPAPPGVAVEPARAGAAVGPSAAPADPAAADAAGLAPTLVTRRPGLALPAQREENLAATGPVRPALVEDLPVTTPTSAFVPPPAVAVPPPPVAAGVPATPRPTAAGGHFVAVSQDELDRLPLDEPASRSLISLQTWGLLACLLAVGSLAYWFLQPQSADQLYESVAAHTHDGSTESLLEVEPQIEQFLMTFAKDPRAEELRRYERDIELYRLERKFERQAAGLIRGEKLAPVEKAYLEAIQYTRFDPDKGIAKLQALVDLYGSRQEDPTGLAGQCVQLARQRLDRLREQVSDQALSQLAVIQDRLDRADQLSLSEPARARAMRQAVLELYGEKPWAAAAVQRARAALAAAEKRAPAAESRPTPAAPPAPPVVQSARTAGPSAGKPPSAAAKSQPAAAKTQPPADEKPPAHAPR